MFRVAVFCAIAAVVLAKGKTPNEKLKECCATLKEADKECVERFCDFNAISQTNILNYLSTCSERGPTVGNMWDCVSLRHDHTECCKVSQHHPELFLFLPRYQNFFQKCTYNSVFQAKGVEGKCLEYCSAQDGVPTNYLDYLFCTESFNEIRDCFHEHLSKNPAFKKH
ncbi:hypothetical protein Y032_0010g1194 [Ancylostoma ceylanicum]|uniref:Domain of unknown function DB domain-containing protein n=1 Tax=Ancylostoma ceylanicum TaxID=53326 RepID=A0A016VGU6_9BILA|nr:hypothetical protein Y032_0010g1194 [Ancylostoma ceylanicum]